MARLTASKDVGGHSSNCPTTYKKYGGSEGPEQGPRKLQLQLQLLAKAQDQLLHNSILAQLVNSPHHIFNILYWMGRRETPG